MKSILIFFISLVILSFGSCRIKKQSLVETNEKFEANVDSFSKIQTPEIIKIREPADSSEVQFAIVANPFKYSDTIQTYKPMRFKAKGTRSSVDVLIDEWGNVTARAKCNELEKEVTVLKTEISRYQSIVEKLNHQKNLTIKVSYIPLWMWLTTIITTIVALLLFIHTFITPFKILNFLK